VKIYFAAGKRMVVAGPREHIFHTVAQVEWYPDWGRLVMGWRSQGLLPDPVRKGA
jgi:hypothetical protein